MKWFLIAICLITLSCGSYLSEPEITNYKNLNIKVYSGSWGLVRQPKIEWYEESTLMSFQYGFQFASSNDGYYNYYSKYVSYKGIKHYKALVYFYNSIGSCVDIIEHDFILDNYTYAFITVIMSAYN